MNRHFLRLYLSLAAAMLAAGLSVYLVQRVLAPPQPVDAAVLADAESAVRDAFAHGDAEAARRSVADRYRVRVDLLPPDAPPLRPPHPPNLMDRIWSPPVDRLVTLDDGRRVRVIWDRPPPHLGPAAVALVVLLAASGALVWWLVGLDRALRELIAGAERFGDHDLSARVAEDTGKPTHELAVAFNAMAERVDHMVKAQQELLTGVSHELRTPLMRLRFAVELLPELDDPAERERRAADIQGDIQELDTLIGEILTFAKVRGSATVDATTWDVDTLLAEVAEETRRLAPERPVDWVPSGLALTADRRLVLRAVRNLATNAVRHGRGVITLAAASVGEDQIEVVVRDQGPGIPASDRTRVREPFVRLDPSRADGGLGLGLALVEQIAALHHGSLEIDDAPGGGARLALVLPAGEAAFG